MTQCQTSRRMSNRLPGVVMTALLFFGTNADAQSNPQQMAIARGIHEQAIVALDRKDYEVACPMLEEAVRIEPSALGARLTLAECYEAADKLASAWGAYSVLELEAKKTNDEKRRVRAREGAAALLPRLAHVVIEVPEAVRVIPGLTIKRDGVALGTSQWGVPVPADKGRRVIQIEAQGRQSTQMSVDVLENGVTVRAVVSEPPRVPEKPKVNIKPDQPTSTWNTQKTVGLIVGGVGVVGVAVGSIAGIVTIQRMNDIRSTKACSDTDPAKCTLNGFFKMKYANESARYSNTFFFLGGTALISSIIIFALAPKKKNSPTNTSLLINPSLGTSMTGILMHGAF